MAVSVHDDLASGIIRDLINDFADKRGRDPDDPAVQTAIVDACAAYAGGASIQKACDIARRRLRDR